MVMGFGYIVVQRLMTFINAPFRNTDMIWIVLPLMITLIAVELYFARYKDEKLGWNTAMSNTLVLVFVSLNLFQYVFTRTKSFTLAISSIGFYIALGVLALGIFLFILEFFHLIPDFIAMTISAHLPINITAYTAIVMVYNQIALDWATIVAWAIMITLLGTVFFLIKKLVPGK